MDDRAARLRGNITLVLVCIVALVGGLIFFLSRPSEPAQIATVAPAAPTPAPAPAPAGPPRYVWDGTWLHAHVPAGVGSMSENIAAPEETTTLLDSDTRDLYDIGCARQSSVDPAAFDHVPCNNKTDRWFYFINKTEDELDIRYHFTAYMGNK